MARAGDWTVIGFGQEPNGVFSELLARIRTVLRRRAAAPSTAVDTKARPANPHLLSFAGWKVDLVARIVCDSDDQPFGEEKAMRIAEENAGASAEHLVKALIEAASRHCGGRFQDDASLIVLKSL